MRNKLPQTKFKDQDQALDHLLASAQKVPASPNLAEDLMMTILLDKASDVPPSRSLAQNILANTDKANALAATNVVSFNPKTHKAPHQPRPKSWAWNTATGGLMAASLILGIWTGNNDVFDPILSAPLELAGFQTTTNTDAFSVFEAIDTNLNDLSLL